ncbi:KAP family P-loop domain-containing protein [Arthrobacter sp. ov407]|nr:KAP family P-loop domain-containing protein [Arthrobacter sp. ov407]
MVGTAVSETVKEFLPSKSWDSAFDDLATAIQQASVKILVVVDDVDRLQPKELLLLMKTVRLLGRFPRVNYLLAYDRYSTISTLRIALGTDRPAAEDYLEKIVQYPLDLPAPQQRFLQKIVFGALGPILDRASANVFGPTAKYRFESFYRDHMWTSLSTPRACHRFALQAKTFLPLSGGNVDAADFFALTFLRLFYALLFPATS